MFLSYLTLALAAASLIVGIFIIIRLKSVHYLLEQPVVKKMSPQLRLKPVKLDEVLNRGGREGGRPEGGRPERRDGDRGPRGEGREGGRRDDRGPRAEGDRGPRGEGRGPRPEGDRGPRPERTEGGRRDDRGPRGEGRGQRADGRPEGGRPEGDRGPRPERTEGDRPRREDRPEGGRGREDRPRREDRAEGGRPPREFSETRDFAPAPQADFAAPAAESAPLSPRRPLFVDSAEPRAEAAPVRENASENFVGSNSDDLQHGRRTQLKKKPKFDFEEETTEG